MVVLFTGMFRSGSTWAYNVARVLLLTRSPAVCGEYRDDVGAALDSRDAAIEHHLIKTHHPDPVGLALIRAGACRTICTYRNVLECIVSYMEAFGAPFDQILALAVDALALLEFQAAAPDVLFIPYDQITQRPADAIAAIAQHLGVAICAVDAVAVAERFGKDNVARFTARLHDHAAETAGTPDVWDSITLFSSRHIRPNPSPPEALLSPAQLRQAVDRLGASIDARGALAGDLAQRLAQARAVRDQRAG
ncbi:MAG TPA: hypothetical protein VMB81_27910 [Candidatus Sulfotelmatobacter sp.]|nr:hypothetical protein [Candidatus Sulfotelmatobacter sp.]